VVKLKLVGINNNYNTEEPKPSSIRKWYNRSQRSWVVQLLDKEENQIGNATYVYSKSEAEDEVNRLKKEYNLE
jgi:hypothetical protein